jgi:hypothetical protein
MKNFCLISLVIFALSIPCAHAQVKTSFLVQSTLEDEWIVLSVDKVVYFAGDTVRLTIGRTDSVAKASIIPVLPIEGTSLKSTGRRSYIAVLPQIVTPGAYVVTLKVRDSEGRRFLYKTECIVNVEENRYVALLQSFVHIEPSNGGENSRSAVALDREAIQNLEVHFDRDSIKSGMGPQFVTIKTTVIPRDGTASQSLYRRVVTFNNNGDDYEDRMRLIQYKNAYNKYAALSREEIDHVRLPVDSLPDWALLVVQIEPDYSITIGAFDRSNVVTKYFRMRGPTFETAFMIGIPKVIYDSQSRDSIEYGNTSAMFRMYYVSKETGNRFPLNLGVGTFGVNSPIDVGVGRGGFAFSLQLDLAEMVRILNISFTNKVNIGLETTQLFSIGKKRRLLIDTQVSLVL